MKRLFIASLLAFAPFTWALDQAGSQRLSDLQQRWAQIQYQMPKDTRADACLLYTSPSPRDVEESRMPSSA